MSVAAHAKPTSKHASHPAKAQAMAQAIAPANAAQPGAAGFEALSNQFLQELWQNDHDFALGAGRYEHASHLPVWNASQIAQSTQFLSRWLDKIRTQNTAQLPPKEAADLALLKNYLESSLWHVNTLREYEWNPAEYNIAGPIDQILNTDYAPKAARLRTLTQRLKDVPAYYAAARQNIKQPSHEHTQLAIQQNPGAISVLKSVQKAAQESDLSKPEKNLLQRRVLTAIATVQAHGEWLKKLDQQAGPHRSFRLGKDLYQQKFAFDIQSGLTAEQLYQQALGARETALTKMDELADQLWPKHMGDAAKPADRFEKIGKVIEKLSHNHVSREQFVPEVKRQIPELMEWVISHNLLTMDKSKPLEVRETPVYQRGVAGAGIEAPGPFRPQDRTYYNVTPFDDYTAEQAESELREYNHWILQILNIHEAIPGHYTQLVYANRSPSLIKSLFGNGAMVEGWAVYGERMMMESGYGGNTPEMWLMYSKWNLRTICNTILDYRVHVLGLEQDEALRFLTKEAFQTESEAKGKWRRVQLTSVQLTSYYSGYAEIMALREERKKALGEKFDLKTFHETLLGFGSAPVRVIRELMQ
jgi:uncharacterized protein (DUF885 family)